MGRLVQLSHDLIVDADDIASLATLVDKTILTLKSGGSWTWARKAEHIWRALAPFVIHAPPPPETGTEDGKQPMPDATRPSIEGCIIAGVGDGGDLTEAEADDLTTELARLRAVARLAAAFERDWRAGSGWDVEACEAADALLAALEGGDTDG